MIRQRLACVRFVVGQLVLLTIPLSAAEIQRPGEGDVPVNKLAVANSSLGVQIVSATLGQSESSKPEVSTKPAEADREKVIDLIRKAQDQIELEPQLDGAIVWDLRLAASTTGPGQIARLKGRLTTEDQAETIKRVVLGIMQSDRYWMLGEGTLDISTEDMSVGYGSDELAMRFYSIALEQFWAGEYDKADWSFARALAESSKDDVLRYWRVATALALDDEKRAEQKLALLLPKYPMGSRTPRIAGAFERFQGTTRRRLLALENRILGVDLVK